MNAQVVFVGGATIDLHITDRAAGPPRFTEDVDVIVDVRSRAEYHTAVEQVLRGQGFKPDMREDAPICRYVQDDITLDVMPIETSVLGFSNRWYAEGYAGAQSMGLPTGIVIRAFSAPYLLATKLEAFAGRGEGDYLASADIEDIVRLVDGRPELLQELRVATVGVRTYLQSSLAALLGETTFREAIPGHLLGDAGSQARAGLVLQRFEELAGG